MRFSKLFLKTYKESPNDADVISHKLMARAGMIKKLASGVYSYLPLGYRVLKKVENIVREEMDNAGAQEILMPIMQPSELWKETGRWETMGAEMMRLNDRHDRGFVLGPTHEEVITDIVRNDISSYKALPVNLYQINTKFRDERRPRFGLMRGREFMMKDAYSFHADNKSLDEEYLNMREAYIKVFNRCGLDFRPVEADGGAIGDSQTEEFHVLAASGEDDILFCPACDYAANSEKAVSGLRFAKSEEELKDLELIDTPNVSSIADVAEFLNIDIKKTIKAMMFKEVTSEETRYVMALIRGDFEVNEVKLANVFGAKVELELIEEDEFSKLGLVKGFTGSSTQLDEKITVIMDYSVENITNGVIGANILDKHYINANLNRDFNINKKGDIRMVVIGEKCPKCEGELDIARGIEVGQVFKLGTKYSESMGATFLDQNGKSKPMPMGCYGIGVSRTVAATIEQNHDEFGIVWPVALAPYVVDIIPANMKNDLQNDTAEKIYKELKGANIDAIIDDRNERAGFKFKDADLIGFPVKIIVGKTIDEGIVEIKVRKTGEVINCEPENIVIKIKEILNNLS